MTKAVIQRPKADEDIDAIVSYLARESPAAARAFLDAIERSYDTLAEQPGIGSTRHAQYVPELPLPLRFHPITRFPRILIYYLDRPEAVEVLRVWDAARGLEALVEGLDAPAG